MKIWKFKVFVSDRGVREIDKWLKTLPPGAKAKIVQRINYLAIWEKSKWHRPYVSKLTGSDKIWEIRAESNKVQYRLLGCFGPKDGEFTLLIGAKEKGGKLEPVNVIETAKQRRIFIYQHERYTDEY